MTRQSSRYRSAAVAMGATLLVVTSIGVPVPVRAETNRSDAIADASVYERYPNGNAGPHRSLRVKGGATRISTYVRFRVPRPEGEVDKAVLRLFARTSSKAGPAVYETSAEWGERMITWNDRPAPEGRALDLAGRIRARRWVRFDVTEAISDRSEYSFLLQGNSRDAVSFKSSETRREPRLIIVTSDSPSPRPTPSPSPSPSPTKPSPTPSPSPSSSPSPTPTPGPVTGDVVIAAAGDIACDPDDNGFNGGEGSSDRCHMEATSDLLVDGDYDAVLTLGDNQYNSGTLAEFMASYDPTWGRVLDITYPTPGNHEYGSQNGQGYFDYFGTRAGERGKGYYSFDLGDWHFVAINSNCEKVACGEGSEQFEWLEEDLADSDARCTLAYWHHPRFSSGHDGNSEFMSDMYEELYDAGAEVLLAGHSHNYERFQPMDPDGDADPDGIREFVVGTGGAFFTGMSTIQPNSAVRNNNTFGILELELDDDAYEWRFIPEPGRSFTDWGSGTCH